jgi:cell wall-associated NlpC family hydrolase
VVATGDDLSPDEEKYPIYLMAAGKWVTYQHDCSGFVRAVAAEAGVPIYGNANQIVDTLQKGGGWTSLGHDASRASQMAAQGNLVIAGRKEPGHGHVAIPKDTGDPSAMVLLHATLP